MAIEKELLDQLLAGRDPNEVFAKDGLRRDQCRMRIKRIEAGVLAHHPVSAVRLAILSGIRSVCRNVHEPDNVRVNSSLGDNRAAVAVADEKCGAILKIEHSFGRSNIVCKCGFRFLHHRDQKTILGQHFIDWLLT